MAAAKKASGKAPARMKASDKPGARSAGRTGPRDAERSLKSTMAQKRAKSRRFNSDTMNWIQSGSSELDRWVRAYNRMGRKLPK